MKFSIITVAFNAEHHIDNLFNSVLSQKFQDYEHIVIDGASTDLTAGIIRSHEDRYRGNLRWVSERDNGIYDAMNKGIRMAQGDYIHILNSDDKYFDSDSLNIVAKSLREGVDLLSTSVLYVMPSRNHVLRMRKSRGWHTIPHPGLFVKRQVYLENPFDCNYRYASDIDFLLKIQGRFTLVLEDGISVIMLAGGAGSSMGCIIETLRIFLKHGKFLRALALARPLVQKLLLNVLRGAN